METFRISCYGSRGKLIPLELEFQIPRSQLHFETKRDVGFVLQNSASQKSLSDSLERLREEERLPLCADAPSGPSPGSGFSPQHHPLEELCPEHPLLELLPGSGSSLCCDVRPLPTRD
jgi:hypothetical protein